MTQFKYLVLALATTAGAVAPPSLRGVKDGASAAESAGLGRRRAATVGDTFELSLAKAVAKNDATLAVAMTPKLRGAAESHMASRPAGRGLDFGRYQTDEPTPAPTAEPTAGPTPAPTLPVGGPAAAACLALEDGTCATCCGGCAAKTTEDLYDITFDFSNDQSLAAGECVCFEGDLDYYSVFLTPFNDCAKVTGYYVSVIACARRPCRVRAG